MKRLYRFLSLITALTCLAACTAAGRAEGSAVALPQLDDCFTERDLSGDWDATAIEIILTGDTAETRSHVVSVNGGTITIMDGGTYVFSGTLTEGVIVVDVKDDERVQLVLNGVDITCAEGPAIRVLQADKVFVTLAEGTENVLANGGGFSEEGVEAVIYSDEDLTFNGTGTLLITSPAGDGIDGKDDVKFTSGTYVITAAGRGIDANDSVRIAGGDFTITTDSDAIRSRHKSNESLGYVYIWGGSFAITAGGGAAKATDTDFGGEKRGMGFMMGGNPQDGDGEMPAMPDFSGEESEMPAPPDFSGEEGEMPAPPDFNGEMPGFAGEDGEMGMMPGFPGEIVDAAEDVDAVSAKGIKASGDIVIIGGDFTFDTADDALHAGRDLTLFDGTLTIASGDDGIHADSTLAILGGTVCVTESSEGLEAEVISVSGGAISVYATDDGLNATSSTGVKESFDAQEGVLIDISGGTLYVNAEGDGIDSNGDLTISGGDIVVSGPQNGMNGALDYNGTAIISGGTVIAAGASGMAENFSDGSTQAAFLVSFSAEAGEITVSDAEGNAILSGIVEKSFGTAVISCPELVVGETYTVSCGDVGVEITLSDTVTGSDTGGMGGIAFRGNPFVPGMTDNADGE